MPKILSTLLVFFILCGVYAQNKNEIRGITITGIKGIKKSLANIIAYDRSHPIPANYKVHLRPELEGPIPKGQNPDAKAVSKFGTLVNGNNYRTTATSAPTQTVQSNFLTIWGSYANVSGRESPYTPPDNCGDVGTTQIIATANCRMKVFAKPSVTGSASTTPTGTSTTILSAIANIELNAFFTNTSLGITSISDPHVRFDRLTGRWFIVAIDVNHTSGSNYCMIAVSNGSTITSSSSFTIFYFSVAGTGGASNDFFDYPTLGVDKYSLYIGGNMFANGRTFSGSNMWVLNKASLINGSLTVTSFPHSITSTDMYTPQGVHNDDPGTAFGYFIGASQTQYSKLVIRRVSYSGSTPTLSGDLNLTTSITYTPKTVPTLGGTAIDGDDRRLCAAMIKKNKITGIADLWVAQGTLLNTSGVGGSGGDRDGALWLEIGNLTSTPTILQSATLYDGVNPTSSAIYYTYPTIALSGQGHNLMGFTSAGPAQYAQASAAGRYRTDPPGNFQSPVDFTTTTSTYNPGANRWGDFTQTVVDPTDDMTMWTFSEYVPTTNAWGVRAAQFKAPPPATPVLANVPTCGTTTTVTINGTSTNNSEFFDPGDDIAAGGPGFNRLKVDVSGTSITVSNIKFIIPTQITADFNVSSGAVSGPYTVTITNPDGQTSNTTFSLSCGVQSCGDPTSLNSSSIDNNNETVSWTGVTGATSYSISYALAGTNNWNTDATTSSTSINLSGLTAGTNYDWRVRATCTGGSGNYITAQFTTTSPAVCNPPASNFTSTTTSNSATLGWAANGAVSYDVQYAPHGTTSWSTPAQNTSTNSITITGLNAFSSYDWQVRSNCANGSSAYSATQTFTTLAVVNCPDAYEPNNTSGTAASIPVNTNINAQISSSADIDYYSFSTTGNQKNIQVTLTSPYNSNLTLYSSNGITVIGTPAGEGTKSVSVIYNTNKPGTYKLLVAGATSGDYSSTQCYTLKVITGSSTFAANVSDVSNNISLVKGGIKLYPVPASTAITISFDAYAKSNADIIIINQLGQQVLVKKVIVNNGTNFNTIDVSVLKSGVYTLKINNGKEIQTKKMIISK